MVRVFISSTSRDLEGFRYAVRDEVKKFEWDFEMMEDFDSQTQTTVDTCCRKVRACDLVLLLLAFRRGSLPPIEKGGDGIHPYTWYEIDAAERYGTPIRALFAKAESWPYEQVEKDTEALQWVEAWRGKLNKIAAFFDHEKPARDAKDSYPFFRGIVRKALGDHRDELHGLMHGLDQIAAGSPWLPSGVAMALSLLRGGLSRLVLPRDQIRAAYRQAHPERIDDLTLDQSVRLLTQAARNLCHMPARSDGGHPVADFLQYLLATAEGDRRRLLLECVTSAGIPLSMRPPVRIPPEPSPGESPAALSPAEPASATQFPVVVYFRPGAQPQAFEVRAWIYEGSSPVELPLDRIMWTRQNRAEMLGRLCDEVHRRAGSVRPLFEFLVPSALVGENLEEWDAMIDAFGTVRVGLVAPVVMRMVERFRAVPLERWRKRWARIQAQLNQPCRIAEVARLDQPDRPDAVWIGDEREGQRLFALLDQRDHVACAILEKAPRAQPSAKQLDAFRALVLAGIPIIIWPRKSVRGRERLRDELTPLLEGHPLDHLPQRMHDFRQKNPKQGVALVWDDPRRPIPQFEQAPPLYLEQRHG